MAKCLSVSLQLDLIHTELEQQPKLKMKEQKKEGREVERKGGEG